MAKAQFVKKARKDIPSAGIKAGESYYWWSFRFGGKHYSKTPPKPSQLTGSAFMSQFLSIQEQFQELEADESLEDNVQNLKDELESLKDETQGSLDNMPEGLQQGSTGELLQERIDAIDGWISDLDAIDFSFDDEERNEEAEADLSDDEKEEARQERASAFWQEKLDEVHNCEASL